MEQKFIANKLGITQSSYSRIETGVTSVDVNKLDEITVILNVLITTIISMAELFKSVE
jgi:transcriptional regulator with XRE-family HTH domain